MTAGTSTFPETEAALAWQEAVARALKGRSAEDALVARSADGLPIGPLYPPGQGRVVWRGSPDPCPVIQRIDHPDFTAASALALEDLGGGADGLTLVLADAPSAHGFGLRIETRDHLEAVFDGVQLDAVTLRFDGGTELLPRAVTIFSDLVERRFHNTQSLRVDFGLDPIGAMAASGGVPAAWSDLRTQTAVTAGMLRVRGFSGAMLRADGRPHHGAGASEAQELAAVVATGVAYLRALEEGGFDLPEARCALSFALVADADIFLSIAKLRALRRFWARIEAACGIPPRPITLHGETSWRMLADREPWTNLLRNAIACSAALLGGTDSITALPYTAPLGLADGFARRLARNMPLVLLAESGIGRVADPAAGSGALDALTDGICVEAWRLFQTIEGQGGMAEAVTSGWWQAQVEATQERRKADLKAGKLSIVGTTGFTNPDEAPVQVLPVKRVDHREGHPKPFRIPALLSRRDAELIDEEGRSP